MIIYWSNYIDTQQVKYKADNKFKLGIPNAQHRQKKKIYIYLFFVIWNRYLF